MFRQPCGSNTLECTISSLYEWQRNTYSEAHKASEEEAALFLKTRQPGMDIHARITKQVTEQLI